MNPINEMNHSHHHGSQSSMHPMKKEYLSPRAIEHPLATRRMLCISGASSNIDTQWSDEGISTDKQR